MQPQLLIPVMDIISDSVVDGEGVREVLFVAGCPHHCEGCHNPQSWSIKNASCWKHPDDLFEILTSNELATGISFSGGEPFLYAKHLLPLARRIKEETDLDIWSWTGYRYEQLLDDAHKMELLKYIDVLVDGHFILELRNTNLSWRGSANQRVLKLENGKIIKRLY